MNCINTHKQRRMIWFDPHEPQNKYDLWLHSLENGYILQVYDQGEWRSILGGSNESCGCPQWVKEYNDDPIQALQSQINSIDSVSPLPDWFPENQPSWWDNIYNVTLKVNDQSYHVYGPNKATIDISTGTPDSPQQTTNVLNWSNTNGSISLGILSSNVNNVLTNVELKYSPDTDIVGTSNNNSTLPTSKAVKDYVDNKIADLDIPNIPQGVNGRILAYRNNSFIWTENTWFTHKTISETAIQFTGNKFRTTAQILLDACIYDCTSNVTSIDIQAFSGAITTFKAGSVIKFKTAPNASLTIRQSWNVINLPNLTANTNTNTTTYTLTANTTYYLHIIMDSIIIYEVAVEANNDTDPQQDIPDFFYWYDSGKYTLNQADDAIESVQSFVNTGFTLDDTSGWPIAKNYVLSSTTINSSNFDVNKLEYSGNSNYWLYILAKNNNFNLLANTALGVKSMTLTDTYTNTMSFGGNTYTLYTYNAFSNKSLVIQSK